jgi:hypothetical protein
VIIEKGCSLASLLQREARVKIISLSSLSSLVGICICQMQLESRRQNLQTHLSRIKRTRVEDREGKGINSFPEPV